MAKIYPDSQVEIQGFMARQYDFLMNFVSFGLYSSFIKSAIAKMGSEQGERILDLGCGTGRNACLMREHIGDSGYILGLDISNEMLSQFKKNCDKWDNVEFINQRVDTSFKGKFLFDKVFMSFVLHGFPHDVRLRVLKNIFDNLKVGGKFCLLDFSEFHINMMPFHHRFVFTTFECKYAFDFVERDWKEILTDAGFGNFKEHFWFKKYVRLLIAEKSKS